MGFKRVREEAPFFTGKHPFCRHATVLPLLAIKDGEAVGRVAAIVDRRFIDYHGRKVGYFGFFEAMDDLEVARALMEGTKEALREMGMEEMIGPMNPSTNYECGMLVDGFSTPAYIMMPHNPPYYPKLMEAVGLHKARDLYANLIIGDGTIPERIQRIATWALKKTPGLRVRTVEKGDVEGEIRRFMRIYHEAWARNWGFVPMSEDEVVFMAKALKSGQSDVFGRRLGNICGMGGRVPQLDLVSLVFPHRHAKNPLLSYFRISRHSFSWQVTKDSMCVQFARTS